MLNSMWRWRGRKLKPAAATVTSIQELSAFMRSRPPNTTSNATLPQAVSQKVTRRGYVSSCGTIFMPGFYKPALVGGGQRFLWHQDAARLYPAAGFRLAA